VLAFFKGNYLRYGHFTVQLGHNIPDTRQFWSRP